MHTNEVLIIGDSFAASNHNDSWTKLLHNCKITNLSSNGSSEYRIFKKLVETDLTLFSHVIMVHSSSYRIYIDHNPLHLDSDTHQTCDLIYQDIKSATQTTFTQNVTWYFENVFNLEQADVVHSLLIEKMINLTATHQTLHLSFFENEKNPNIINLNSIWKKHPGSINHLDNIGNRMVANFIETAYNITKDAL
jgi:hypothetical protein